MGSSSVRGGYLLDTHIWLWHLSGANELSPGLRSQIDEWPDNCWLSPISIWETSNLARKGKITINIPFRSWLEGALVTLPLREARLSNEIVLLSTELDLPHQDPADRFIAATALTYDLTLLTVDERLISAHWLPTRNQ